MSRNEKIGLFISGILFAIVLAFVISVLKLVDTAQAIQITISFVLVLITTMYVKRTSDIAQATKKQAEASVKMVEEMREQRRPIVIQKVVPPPYKGIPEGDTEIVTSDCFEILNVGNSPAIELEMMLLDQEKRLKQAERRTFLSHGGEKHLFEVYPATLENSKASTCYLFCRYRGAFSPDEGHVWYETWLPFEPVKSQRGDRVIIKPGELEFNITFEKKSY